MGEYIDKYNLSDTTLHKLLSESIQNIINMFKELKNIKDFSLNNFMYIITKEKRVLHIGILLISISILAILCKLFTSKKEKLPIVYLDE